MSEVERRQNQRSDYLVALYELSDGNPVQWATHRQIAERARLPEDEVMMVGQVITAQHLAEFVTLGGLDGNVSITASGIRRAEEVIRSRELEGQGRYANVISLTDVELVQKIEPLLAAIRVALEDDTSLDPETRSDLRADIESVDIQTKAAKPNRGVIKASFDRIRTALPAAALVASLAVNIEAIIHGLGV